MKYFLSLIIILFFTSCIQRSTISTPFIDPYELEREKEQQQYNKNLKEIKYLTQAIQNEPKNPKLRYYRGLVYLIINNGQNAHSDFKTAISFSPDNPDYNCAFGLSYIILKNQKMATKYLNIGNSLNSTPNIGLCRLLSENVK